jgi:hypothetical protein
VSTRGKQMGPNEMVVICVSLPEYMSMRTMSAGDHIPQKGYNHRLSKVEEPGLRNFLFMAWLI